MYVCTYACMYVLPLSHKSGALCLYEPLLVSDALGDDFFEISDVFLVDHFFFLSSLHGPTATKKTVAPKKAIFCSLSGENSSTKTKTKKQLDVLVVAGRQKVPSLLEGHRIVFYRSFQRPRHLPHPHPGMLHT